jgi:hypothetical protein
MIDQVELIADETTVDSDTEALFGDLEKLGDAVLIIGQLDPTEVDGKMLPRWSPAQRELIIAAAELVGNWTRE